MRLVHVTLLPLLFAAGCAAIAPEGSVAPKPGATATQPATPPPAAEPSAASTPQPVPAAVPAPIAPRAAPQAESKVAPPGTKTPAAAAKLPAAPAPASTVAKPGPHAAAATTTPVAPPALDLAALKEQLKETKAIGVFTKITLRNQVDDLLQQFRDYYQGKAKITMAQLRRSYDLLLMKVLSLLQDADQKLAAAIVSSREAIWGLLADPKKFATLDG